MYSKEIITIVKRKSGDSYNKIASDLCLTKSTVQCIVNTNYNKVKKRRGPKKKINKRQAMQIKRYCESTMNRITAPKVTAELQLNVSARTAHRQLKRMGYSYTKADVGIVLSKKHRDERIKYARSGWKSVLIGSKWFLLTKRNLMLMDPMCE